MNGWLGVIHFKAFHCSEDRKENLEEDASDNLVIDEDVRSPESGNSNSRCGSMSPTNNTSTATTVGIGNGETEESDPLRINSVDSPSSPQSDKMTIDEEGGRDLLSAPPRSSFQGFGGSISSRGAKDVCRKPENIVRFGIMNKQDEHCSRWRPKLKLLFFRDKGTFN
ncbi:hypothetical protein Fcan01_21567 [Folsomia candida]|uniref:Uncharacterized protein n=1 Tax=Folsomia candida TaxID=158441 RepID=A0A226DFY6_FOLCA|nr:hypothetical protein Fcan01_21567 [Folsomia candida]